MVLVLLHLAAPALPAADGGAAASPTGRTDETNTQDLLRSYLQVQEQLHATQLAIQRNREETDAGMARNAELLAGRLHDVEQALAAQRGHELELMQNSNSSMQSSNRVMLLVAGSFAAIGFFAMVLMALFQWRTINRLAELSAILPGLATFRPGSPVAMLEAGEAAPGAAVPAASPNPRLLGVIDRLEKRILELEQTARTPLKDGTAAVGQPSEAAVPANGKVDHGSNGNGQAHEVSGAEPAGIGPRSRIASLLGQGQLLLDRDDAQGALACFEEALNLEADNAEALVKKGTALEKMQRLDAALGCYDQAIASNRSLTIAYLYKGGLCNRMERFDEALKCYEQALRTQA
jgi:tetratricopeptide (TPR) repeat protein